MPVRRTHWETASLAACALVLIGALGPHDQMLGREMHIGFSKDVHGALAANVVAASLLAAAVIALGRTPVSRLVIPLVLFSACAVLSFLGIMFVIRSGVIFDGPGGGSSLTGSEMLAWGWPLALAGSLAGAVLLAVARIGASRRRNTLDKPAPP